MFEGFSKRTIDFMWDIRFNNNRPWFNEHKDTYINDFLNPMKALGETVYDDLKKECEQRYLSLKVSRIYRDARRLHGAMGPYKDCLWFSFEKRGDLWTNQPVFWFELSPEQWSYGMGYYSAHAESMAKLRARIDKDPKAFEKLILPLKKQDEFVLEGDEYVRKKTAPTEKTQDWYNKKSFSLIHTEKNSPVLFSPDLAETLTKGYQFLLPLYDYFVTLDSDEAPV